MLILWILSALLLTGPLLVTVRWGTPAGVRVVIVVFGVSLVLLAVSAVVSRLVPLATPVSFAVEDVQFAVTWVGLVGLFVGVVGVALGTGLKLLVGAVTGRRASTRAPEGR